ncbi:pyrroline-5-carboxylate reductase [uncultured Algimonas sp.]|uniref:pyrroline-5-carboxylate reductase n=1 Tax=uncultured Algimonas sp. TaxID=1547920 RepID=UPI00260BDF71|nr:pyrroline-5-carboxylate reductase [uncultured Algimonas sp.]
MAQTHLIVGAGHMGGALLAGWLQSGLMAPRHVAVLDPAPGTEAVYAIERGAKHLPGPGDIPRTIETVLLAVKPQLFPDIGADIAKAVGPDALIISIMAGLTLGTLSAVFEDNPIVRAMPNMPVSVGQGMTAFVADDFPDRHLAQVEALLGASGAVLRVESDTQIDAVTAISGSGPAYLFHVCETLAAAGLAIGLPEETARQLARQTVIGASAMLEASDASAAELREAVTSPGGTTQAALDVLGGSGELEALMRRAAQAAFRRAGELSG